MDWYLVPQFLWSLYMMIDDMRGGIIGPRGLAAYLALFTLLLVVTRWKCRLDDERAAARAARRA